MHRAEIYVGTAARTARDRASARTVKSGTFACLAVVRAFASTAVTGTDACSAKEKGYVSTTGERMFVQSVMRRRGV